ncbi:unnamed protein product [Rhodiola kirilowii]
MSHAGSRVAENVPYEDDNLSDQEEDQFELPLENQNQNQNRPEIDNNEEVQQVIYDNPEQLFRDQRRAQRDAARKNQNQGAAADPQRGGPIQGQVPARQQQAPVRQQVAARQPVRNPVQGRQLVRNPVQGQQQVRQQAPVRQQIQYQVQPQPPLRRLRQPVYEEEAYYHDEEPSMGELLVPDFKDQTWPIYEGPELEDITISTSIVHHLPKFAGSKGESATGHLKRYHGSCHNYRPFGASVDDFKLKAFYFSLTESATDWFLSLPADSIYTWEEMQRQFLSKYYPAGRAMKVRRQLQELKQGPNETLSVYVEKFLALEKSCCNLELPEKLLVEYLLDGICRLDRKLLDASAGGNLMNLSPAKVKQMIISVAESERFQDEATKEDDYARTRNVSRVEPSISAMVTELKEMRELMKHVVRRQPVQVRPCEFCASTDHKTDECPTIVEDDQAEINAVGNYQNYGNQPGPVRQFNAAAPNQGATGQSWRNNNQQNQAQPARQNAPQQTQQPYQHPHHHNQSGPSNHGKPIEKVVEELAASTKSDIEDIKKQISQLTATVTGLAATLNAGRLPSQTVENPRGNVSLVEVINVDAAFEETTEPTKEEPALTAKDADIHGFSYAMQVVAPESQMTEKAEPELRMVVRPTQNDQMTMHSPTASQQTPSGKSKDPGAFTVTCGIGKTQIPHCLIDLGAAINVMPYSLYCSLGLGPLKPPRISIELGDKSCVLATGLLEDLTLRVGDITVPADFYVLQMEKSRKGEPPGLILGRPFLHTTQTRIDMGIGLLSLSFGGKEADFYVYEDANRPCARKPPDIVHTSEYDTLVPDPPEQAIQTTRPAAMAKTHSPSRGYVKKKPPDYWRAEPSEQLDEQYGRTEGVAEQKYDLTRPWDPNL